MKIDGFAKKNRNANLPNRSDLKSRDLKSRDLDFKSRDLRQLRKKDCDLATAKDLHLA